MAHSLPPAPSDWSFRFKPLNPAQERLARLWPESDVVFALGPPGGGKTHAAVALALSQPATKLLFCRPLVPCGPGLGFFKGGKADKLEPWSAALRDVCGRMSEKSVKSLIAQRVEVEALDYVAGRTFRDTVAVLDEAQNATWQQLELFVARVGPGGKVVLCGDDRQCHLHRPSALGSFAKAVQHVARVAVVHFPPTDNLRHPIIPQILKALSNYRE